jgi:hypothetical protein
MRGLNQHQDRCHSNLHTILGKKQKDQPVFVYLYIYAPTADSGTNSHLTINYTYSSRYLHSHELQYKAMERRQNVSIAPAAEPLILVMQQPRAF